MLFDMEFNLDSPCCDCNENTLTLKYNLGIDYVIAVLFFSVRYENVY